MQWLQALDSSLVAGLVGRDGLGLMKLMLFCVRKMELLDKLSGEVLWSQVLGNWDTLT